MKFVLNRINFILHPSYFILPCTPSLTVGLPLQRGVILTDEKKRSSALVADAAACPRAKAVKT